MLEEEEDDSTVLMVAGLALDVDEARKDVNFDVRNPSKCRRASKWREGEKVRGWEKKVCAVGWFACFFCGSEFQLLTLRPLGYKENRRSKRKRRPTEGDDMTMAEGSQISPSPTRSTSIPRQISNIRAASCAIRPGKEKEKATARLQSSPICGYCFPFTYAKRDS